MKAVIKKLSVSKLRVDQVMSRNIYCLSSDVKVIEAIKAFTARQISGAPLILPKTEILISVVSESDLLKFAAMDGLYEPLKNFLDRLPKMEDLITVRENESFGQLFKKFLLKPVRRVIVTTDSGHVVGIVSRRDIINAFVAEAEKKS